AIGSMHDGLITFPVMQPPIGSRSGAESALKSPRRWAREGTTELRIPPRSNRNPSYVLKKKVFDHTPQGPPTLPPNRSRSKLGFAGKKKFRESSASLPPK